MTSIVEFDFKARTERAIGCGDIPRARAEGRYCWIDLEAPSGEETEAVISALELEDEVRGDLLSDSAISRFEIRDHALHLSFAEMARAGQEPRIRHIEVVAGDGFLLTFHRHEVESLRRLRHTYRNDFLSFGQTFGFLLFEIGDHLIARHRHAVREAADAVEQVQMRLFETAGDEMFQEVARLVSDLNALRSMLLGAREVFHEIASRKSRYIPESTQPFVERLAVAAERLSGDVESERNLLQDSLNLYLGMVSHKTNRIVTRLTVLSAIFLPLTFLCGVYGMNFEHFPELQWRYSYMGFWALAGLIVAGLLGLMRRARWI